MNNPTPSLVLSKIAFYRGIRNEIPNQELARELAGTRNTAGIREIAGHLGDRNKNVQSDCVKVLYEIGYLAPDLIAPYTGDFLKLIKNKNNRLVWGGMIALATVAELRADEIWPSVDDIMGAVATGSVITTVWGVRALAKVAASDGVRCSKIFPFLLQQIKTCLPRDVPLHAESMLCTLDETVKAEFLAVLSTRQPELTPTQALRLEKVLKTLR